MTAAAIRARIADIIDDGGPADVAFAKKLIVSFLERTPGLHSRFTEALATADSETATYHAHAFKGAASNIGAAVVADLCAEAEELAKAGDWGRLAGYPDRLSVAIAEAADELNLALTELNNS